MKILIYCQHVLGIGHLFRTIEICRALKGNDVVLVTGGPAVAADLPDHVREFKLPQLKMDSSFKGLYASRSETAIDQVKDMRRKLFYELFQKEQPDLFIIELYPFGRKAFRFELDPVLRGIREKQLSCWNVICSVRDILVEKEDQQKHELRAVKTLNRYFDAVLVHADPRIVRLDETFLRFDQIVIPVVYTGFVAPKPSAHARRKFRKKLGMDGSEIYIVASAGGGSVGYPLLESVIEAFKRLKAENPKLLHIFTGPFIGEKLSKKLRRIAGPGVRIDVFSCDFLSYLAAADLSISMGGYNTSMNILATGVPALVWPFPQNREQRLRAQRLAESGALRVLNDSDLQPQRLVKIMHGALSQPRRGSAGVDLDGAGNTAKWLQSRAERGIKR